MALLAWSGEFVGPVTFGGVTFWAAIEVDREGHRRRRERGLAAVRDRACLHRELRRDSQTQSLKPVVSAGGCIIASDAPATAIANASLFAGYSRRAVLVPDTCDVIRVLVDASILDQGVVLRTSAGLERLADPGPRVPGHGFDAREWEFLEALYDAWLRTTTRNGRADVA